MINLKLERLAAYFELGKPRVVALMLLTALAGMLLSPLPTNSLSTILWGLIGIGCMASAGGAFNHLIDRHYDTIMHRTAHRPLPTRQIHPTQAISFGILLGSLGMSILILTTNTLTALLTLLSLSLYAFIYTIFLKRNTPQNIVIGGLAGAMPPLLGWCAITNRIEAPALLLVMIIFTWTPPHFWALAIHRKADYQKANIPMLPITHGVPFTQLWILLYTCLMITTTLLPFCIGMSGWFYLTCCLILNARFLQWACRLYYRNQPTDAFNTFRYSIIYLALLFIAMGIDHYL